MTRARRFLAAFLRNQDGAVLIETAIVAPVLMLMSLGAFQASMLIARQTELQSAASEASSIALVSPPETQTALDNLKTAIVNGNRNLAAGDVTVSQRYRCGSNTAYVTTSSSCIGVKVSHYVLIQLVDRYTPFWSQFGLGSPIDFRVDRYVMVKQA